MTGTLVNTGAVLLGGAIGLLAKNGLPERITRAIYRAEGVAILAIALNGIVTTMISADPATGRLSESGGMLLLISLVLGVLAGELLRIDGHLSSLGARIEHRMGADGFAAGFVSASIVFCVGAMSIVGSLSDGLTGDSSVLFLKSGLDCVTSIVLASSLGFGVLFAAGTVLVYQGAITLCAGLLAPLISGALLDSVCMVGYAIVAVIGANFLLDAKLKTANFLPALLVPILYQAGAHLFSLLFPGA